MNWHLPIGAHPEDGGTRFRVWAPAAENVDVVLFEGEREIANHSMSKDSEGYFVCRVEDYGPGTRYMYRLDGDKLRPDPASRYQPEGVHGPSEVLDPAAFKWSDQDWKGLSPESSIIYELHTGTFTAEGTFEAIVEKLDYLRDLGITAIEILPVADFPGHHNWGYDGVSLYAPAHSYGHPHGLMRVVNEAHARGLAVILDVVYNHLGPDGNYLRDFSPDYFTENHHTPWGQGLNYECHPVRDFFFSNAFYWAHEFHVDGLRLDATHAIQDNSKLHFLAELGERLRASLPQGRNFILHAEDERNERKLVLPKAEEGYGLDGVWADDFHHQMRVAFAGDRDGYFQDYEGTTRQLADTINAGWFYQGQRTKFRGEPRGTPAEQIQPSKFIYCIQNHDQIGNRAMGDRLTESVSLAAFRAMSTLLLCSPYTPLLFQGQEWAATTPWQFFTDHNPDLGKLVTEGRRKEFEGFSSFSHQEVPDPQDPQTFERSKLNWKEVDQEPHSQVRALYKDLLELRVFLRALCPRRRGRFVAMPLGEETLAMRTCIKDEPGELLLVMNIKGTHQLNLLRGETAPRAGTWRDLLFSENKRYGGRGEEVCQYELLSGALKIDGPCAILLRSE